MYDVFISYASQDLAIAEALCKSLCAAGLKVWFDKARLKPGFNWYEEIESAVENSRVILPVLTPRWKESDWTKFETYGAEVIVPLIAEGEWDDVKTSPLERYQAEMITVQNSVETTTETLAKSITKLLANPIPNKIERLSNLKYRPNEYFTGREKELIQIHEEFHSCPKTALSQGRIRVITAMGGCGKTTLARHYAEKYWKCYPQIFWVDCRSDIEGEFANIHDLLHPERAKLGLEDKEKAKAALRELSTLQERLLILDNVEDEESCINWIPKTGACHTLITSRYAFFSPSIHTITLCLLSEHASVSFLKSRVNQSERRSGDGAYSVLAEKLGYLPLALEQAAAYIEQQGLGFSVEEYLLLYDAVPDELLAGEVRGSTEYPGSVKKTLLSTRAKLSPMACSILRLSSFLANIPLPLALFTNNYQTLAEHSHTGVTRTNEAAVQFAIRKEMETLKAYSMIQWDGRELGLHPLLAQVEQLSESEETFTRTWKTAVEIVKNESPKDSWKDDCRIHWQPEHGRQWMAIWKHINHLCEVSKHRPDLQNDPYFMFIRINALASHDHHAEALACCINQPAITTTLDQISSIELDILEDRAYLQRLNRESRDSYDSFMSLAEHYSRSDGENSEIALRMRHNAACSIAAFDTKEAEQIMSDVFEARKQHLGLYHYDTITSAHDIGWLKTKNGDHAGAENYYKEAYTSFRSILGNANPDTVTSVFNLSIGYNRQNKHSQAKEVLDDLYRSIVKDLGKDHLEVYRILAKLSDCYQDCLPQDQYYQLLVDIIAGLKKYLDAGEHVIVSLTKKVVIHAISSGRFEEADSCYRSMIDSMKIQSSDEAVDYHNELLGLAITFAQANLHAKSVHYIQTAFNLSVENGLQTTFLALNAIAACISCLTESNEISLWVAYLRLIDSNVDISNLDNPEDVKILEQIGIIAYNTGAYEVSLQILQQVFVAQRNYLADDSPDIASSYQNLGLASEKTGDAVNAFKWFDKAYDLNKQLYGPDHDKTLNSLVLLYGVCDSADRHDNILDIKAALSNLTDPVAKRTLALMFYREQDYKRAEELLLELSQAGFDPGSTNLHLARICIIKNRLQDAKLYVKASHDQILQSQPYVKVRNLWMQLLLCYLNEQCFPDQSPADLVSQIKSVLLEAKELVAWDMTLVLEAIEGNLPEIQLAFLSDLVAAYGSKQKIADLDKYTQWRET